jgi:hypothetical protein
VLTNEYISPPIVSSTSPSNTRVSIICISRGQIQANYSSFTGIILHAPSLHKGPLSMNCRKGNHATECFTCLNSSNPSSTCVIPDFRIASAIACKSANPYMHTHGDPAMRFQPDEIPTIEPRLPSNTHR